MFQIIKKMQVCNINTIIFIHMCYTYLTYICGTYVILFNNIHMLYIGNTVKVTDVY